MRRWATLGAMVVILLVLLNLGEYSFVLSQRAAFAYWDWRFRAYPVISGQGYQFRLSPSMTDSQGDLVALADEYMAWLDEYFGFSPPRPRIIATDFASLNRVIGGQYSLETSGAYQAGVVIVGFRQQPTRQEVAASALLHELGHHYVHYLARGNYPIWYSEGVTQLVELRLLGYRWFDGIGKYDYYMYSILEINNSFHSLHDQVSAYKQALELAILMEELGGVHAHRNILQALGKGMPFGAALEMVTGLTQEELFAAWSGAKNSEGAK
jgi:hypothetical protein